MKIQDNIPKRIKIAVPIFGVWGILALTTLVPLPSYILTLFTTVLTLVIYVFIKKILEKEEKIIKEYNKEVNHFQELFVNMSEENKKLSGDLESEFKDFDKYVISSKTDLFGRITYASRAFCDISGYTREELLGKAHSILRHKDEPKSKYKDLWDTIQDDRIWSGELRNIKKNKQDCYWIKTIISPIYDYDGNKIGYNSIKQDITEERLLTGELEEGVDILLDKMDEEIKLFFFS